MKPVYHHRQYVECNPADRTAALALADHFQEEFGDTRYHALRAVAAITLAAKRAKRLAVAARWLAHRGDVGGYLKREIRRSFAGSARPYALRLLVEGFSAPRLIHRAGSARLGAEGRRVIFVSAGWVIMRVAEWHNPACNGAAILIAKYGPKRLNKEEKAAIARKIGQQLTTSKGK